MIVVSGLVGLVDALSYTPDQRAAVPRLWVASLGGKAIAGVVGGGAMAWILVGKPALWLHTVVIGDLGIALPLIHHRLQQAL